MSVTTIYGRLPRVVCHGKHLGYDVFAVIFRRPSGFAKSYWAWIDDTDYLNIVTYVHRKPVSFNVYCNIADRTRAAIDNYLSENPA